MEWAETIAYGPLSLKPREFERLQPHEFLQLWDGHKWRQEQQENMFAYFTCCLMNVEGKSLRNNLTPKDILKPLRPTEVMSNKHDDEEYLKEKFGLI